MAKEQSYSSRMTELLFSDVRARYNVNKSQGRPFQGTMLEEILTGNVGGQNDWKHECLAQAKPVCVPTAKDLGTEHRMSQTKASSGFRLLHQDKMLAQ
ncbi:hypothetical protein Tco_0822260 [Tanacetum coccineum]|uniref:Uncharacterized protein n=1 Tax=Tanacetum coccineum TaxID=301880 RepID=A0ABQ5AFM3_9ASTR